MGNKNQTEKRVKEIMSVLDVIEEGKRVDVSTIGAYEALQEAVDMELIENKDGIHQLTLKGKEYVGFNRFQQKELVTESENQKLKEQEYQKLQEQIELKLLSTLKEDSGSSLAVDDIKTYDALQSLVDKGYALCEDIADVKHYTKTKKGNDYYDFKRFQEGKDTEYEVRLKESYIAVTYKKKHEELDLIESVTDKFLLEEDGIPVIRVTGSQYKALLDRNLNEHWQRYVGEGGSKLIKKKKLKRFYVENTENKRRYLYLVPQD